MVFAEGDGQLDYVQREVYAGSERIEQFTDRSNGGYERLLYVHEDLMGNTRYYTKANGQSYAELTYDAWGMPESPNKLLNNDHGNYVYATYTGHIFDTTLDIYFAEARFYDANTRTWLAMDPIKDGDNWYQYCYSNPLKYWDPLGLKGFTQYGCNESSLFYGIAPSINAGITAALYEYEVNGGDIEALGYYLLSLGEDTNRTSLGEWLYLYEKPTIQELGRIVLYPEKLEGKYFEGKNTLGWYSQEPMPNRNAEKYLNGLEKIGSTYVANEGRYVIALGPNVVLPDYPLEGKIAADEFPYGLNVDVIITDKNGEEYYIPCTFGDVKAHTYPNGLYQTGEAYPNAYGNPKDEEAHANGSTVEFVTGESLGILRDYSLKGLIVYD